MIVFEEINPKLQEYFQDIIDSLGFEHRCLVYADYADKKDVVHILTGIELVNAGPIITEDNCNLGNEYDLIFTILNVGIGKNVQKTIAFRQGHIIGKEERIKKVITEQIRVLQ